MKLKKTITFLILFFCNQGFIAQNLFVNGGLNGIVGTSVAPPSWNIVPLTSPIILAGALNNSVDVLNASGPGTTGRAGIPFEGTTCVGGAFGGYDNEGIEQLVNGLLVGGTYTLSFYQSSNMSVVWFDPTGMWRVYIDNTLAYTSPATTSTISYNDLNLQWQFRSFTFVATNTSHLFSFMPFDDDASYSSASLSVYMSLDAASLQVSSPLPVELISIKASVTSDRQVDLEWETATETNNDYFVVERSSNFEDWTAVAQVDGAGDSEEILYYKARDLEPLTGISYYRLKLVNEDKKISYSEMKSVKLDLNLGGELLTVFPNPATTEFTVYGERLFHEDFSLFNSLGESVPLVVKASSDDMIVYSLDGMKKGIYILNYNTGMEIIRKKVFIEK